jgi:hypothetical protein
MASVTSIAAFVGVVYWGVTLSQLDPNNVPVIKKAMGPARVAPNDPGGEQASFQGLSVNEVQAKGGAAKPATKVYLAPSPRPFQNEDVAGLKIQKASNVIAEPDVAPILKEAQFDPIPVSATVEQTALIVAPKIKPVEKVAAPDIKSVDTPVVDAITKPVIDKSMSRPLRRPAKLQLATPTVVNETPSKITTGTALVQLGAFDAEVVAEVQWGAIKARHADLMNSKTHVVQKTKKAGKTFYRLRVQGFADKSAANGFCTALKARGTDCISVTVR